MLARRLPLGRGQNTTANTLIAGLSLASLACMAAAPAHADRVDDYIKQQMALNHVPGAAVAIVRDGKLTKLQAYGIANHGRKLQDWGFDVDKDGKILGFGPK